jgi:prepilin-type processing-associated H-X9-DG protein
MVELLVVVAVIGILAAVILPALRKTLTSGQQTACTGNLRSLIAGWQLYCADHNGNSFRYDWANVDYMRYPYWAGQMAQYLGDDNTKKVFLCPTANKPNPQGGVGSSTQAWSEPHAGELFASSYGLNAYWYSNLAEMFPGDPDLVDVIGNVNRATFPTPVIADSAWVDNQWMAPVPSDFVKGTRWAIARHRNKGINMAFSDGSVRFATMGEYYRDYRMHANDVVPHLDRYEKVPPQYR